MTLQTRLIEYHDAGKLLEGYLVWDDSHSGPRPAVLVAHQWDGRSPFIEDRARAVAGLGYVAFALDLYGKGVRGSSVEENQALMTPLMQDRPALARRMHAALDVLRAQPEVDGSRVAVIGYCFGGLCALDLARSGADLRAAASFHGLLKPPGGDKGRIQAAVLVMHGADDPMAPMEDVAALKQELSAAGCDWQLHMYGHARHAFAVPGAHNEQLGLAHDARAERRSWHSLVAFLEENLGT
jgi:Dienelactone hydrolase and related enzymes